jgi:hypothetical protein
MPGTCPHDPSRHTDHRRDGPRKSSPISVPQNVPLKVPQATA